MGLLNEGWFLLPQQAYHGHEGALGVLVKTLVSLNMRDTEGRTALYLAASMGFPNCVIKLLENSASYTLRDQQNWTPLHAAGVWMRTHQHNQQQFLRLSLVFEMLGETSFVFGLWKPNF